MNMEEAIKWMEKQVNPKYSSAMDRGKSNIELRAWVEDQKKKAATEKMDAMEQSQADVREVRSGYRGALRAQYATTQQPISASGFVTYNNWADNVQVTNGPYAVQQQYPASQEPRYTVMASDELKKLQEKIKYLEEEVSRKKANEMAVLDADENRFTHNRKFRLGEESG